MSGVALKLVAAKICGEQLLAELHRLTCVGAIEAMRLPGLLACLDDDRRQVAAELIGMNLKPAVRGFLEREGKGREFLRRTEPHEAAFAHVDMGFKDVCIAIARRAVDAVGGDDEIRVSELDVVRDLVLEGLLYSELCRALLQQRQQAHAANAAEPVAV